MRKLTVYLVIWASVLLLASVANKTFAETEVVKIHTQSRPNPQLVQRAMTIQSQTFAQINGRKTGSLNCKEVDLAMSEKDLRVLLTAKRRHIVWAKSFESSNQNSSLSVGYAIDDGVQKRPHKYSLTVWFERGECAALSVGPVFEEPPLKPVVWPLVAP